ncbi:MAG: transcriptional regulator [Alteromonadaceae bacterium]|uniref:QsdR family transcriptional regulator n=1 Tax=unclassified Marinobacter TaxID=83889 RepID=UPI000C649C97|nr:QsdR family transcriptional regulator [Marinobacter sp. BGYM27]MAA65870.1 transcriptional regulator [Alteromonadaceae bacterium]MBH85452.1 transcriptional regulator [Alteromonadaceae bacterium]MDG5499990.1 QsdR family transcriptional regulator [Marinobacter sp. BGYM27]
MARYSSSTGDAPVRAQRATPDDAFRKAREHWLKGRKIHLASLAEELNIGRATLFRWVGNKDLLLGDVLWSLYDPIRKSALSETPGEGIDYVVGVYRTINLTLLNAEPVRRFISHDPEYALRILTSASSTVHSRTVNANTQLLRSEQDKGRLKLPMKLESLSYFMVRLAESCLYSDVICGREPQLEELEESCKAVRILLGGSVQK